MTGDLNPIMTPPDTPISGSPLELACNFTVDPARTDEYEVTWSRQLTGAPSADDIFYYYNGSTSLLGGVDANGTIGFYDTVAVFTLTLAYSNESDTGSYSCRVQDTGTMAVDTATADVTVLGKAQTTMYLRLLCT